MVKYSYEKIANISLLTQEISSSEIVIALDHINYEGGLVDIWFKSSLSEGDQSILSSIISNHDFSNYVNLVDRIDLDNKTLIHETSKPLGAFTYFTSAGDDIENKRDVGNGDLMTIEHDLEDLMEQSIYVDLNIKENRTWIHEGYVIWKNAEFDLITMSIVPRLTSYTEDSNTNYTLLPNGLIIPANGDGNISINNIQLVEVTIQESDKKRPPAFWDASYNYDTHEFYNIIPNFNGTGCYNMFGTEIDFVKFVNKIMFVDSGFILLQTADAAEIGEGCRFKFKINTVGSDHAWKASCILTLQRMRTA